MLGSELMDTSLAMQALQLALDMNEKDIIQARTVALNDISRPYAERVMDEAISNNLKGNKIDAI